MNRQTLRELQSASGYPAVTMILPTHPATPNNAEDRIRISNLLDQASDRLIETCGKREAQPLLRRLQALVDEVDYGQLSEGLALFANAELSHLVNLPFAPQMRLIIDDDFYTRDLIYALNRSPRYWVLVLSEQPTRLYAGLREQLVEVQDAGFPLEHTGPGGEQQLPGGVGINTSAYRDEQHRQFFREVDEALGEVLANNDPLPLVVVGVERYLAFFDAVSEHLGAIVGTVQGSHADTSVHELVKLVWPVIQEHLETQRDASLDQLDLAIKSDQYAAGVTDVWQPAQEGRGALLLVEEGLTFTGRLDDSGRRLLPAQDDSAPGAIRNAVDEIVNTVLDKGGRVIFMADGKLADHQRIALVLRY